MHQPQEFKRLWLARKTTELNQTCFDRVKGEAEGAEALVQLLHISPRLLLVLESQYHVIGIAGDDDIARCPLLPPCLTPKVKDVMQIKIRQEGRDDQPLSNSLLRLDLGYFCI